VRDEELGAGKTRAGLERPHFLPQLRGQSGPGSFQPCVLPADVPADHRQISGDGVLQNEERKECLLHLRTLPDPHDVRLV